MVGAVVVQPGVTVTAEGCGSTWLARLTRYKVPTRADHHRVVVGERTRPGHPREGAFTGLSLFWTST